MTPAQWFITGIAVGVGLVCLIVMVWLVIEDALR